MTDIASLRIRIETLEARVARRDLDGLSRSAFNLQGVLAGVTAAIAALGLAKLSSSFIAAAAQIERFEIQLTTLAGSSQVAKQQMQWIKEFAKTTPYDINQVTNSFVKLQAYGLDATKWMRVLGNTASSMGKDLDQAVEMFADAMTGEFERLKEFGIRATQEADKVTFNWIQNGQSMVLSTGKTSDEISAALGKIFSRFEGGMEAMSHSWDGIMSNIGDTWHAFQIEVMESGPFYAMKISLKEFLDYLDSAQGQMDLSKWAQDTAVVVLESFQIMVQGVKLFLDAISGVRIAMAAYIKYESKAMIAAQKLRIEGLSTTKTSLMTGRTTVGAVENAEKIAELKVLIAEREQLISDMDASIDRTMNGFENRDAMFKELIERMSDWKRETGPIAEAYDTDWTNWGEGAKAVANVKNEVVELTDEAKKAAEAVLKANEAINDEILKLTLTSYDYEVQALDGWKKEKAAIVGATAELEQLYQLKLAALNLENRYSNRDQTWDDDYSVYMSDEETLKRNAQAIRDAYELRVKEEEKAAKKILDAREKLEKEQEKALEKQQQDYNRMVEKIQDFTADTFHDIMTGQVSGWEDMAERMKNIFIRMLAEIAAEAAMTRIILPVAQSMGLMMPPGSGGVVGGVNPISSILSKGLTSKFGSNIGTALFGARWLGAPAGVSSFGGIGAAGGAYAGPGIGAAVAGGGAAGTAGIAGTLAAAAPFLAMAAMVAVPLIMKAFKKTPTPRVGFIGGPAPDFVGEGEETSKKYPYYPWLQDVGNRKEMGDAVRQYFDARLGAIEAAFDIDMKDILSRTAVRAVVDPGQFQDDPEGMMKALEGISFDYLRENMLEALFKSVVKDFDETTMPEIQGMFDKEFFDSIIGDDEGMYDTFIRFGTVVKETDDFMGAMTRQMEEFGLSVLEAYQNVETITLTLLSLQETTAAIANVAAWTAIVDAAANLNGMIDAMKDANATIEDITEAETHRNEVLGSMITGINGESFASGLWNAITNNQSAEEFVKSLEDQVRIGIAQATVNAFASSLYDAFLAPVNQAMGAMVAQIVAGQALSVGMISGITASLVAATESLILLLNNDEFKEALQNFLNGVKSIMPTTPATSSGAGQITNTTVTDAADKTPGFVSIIDGMLDTAMAIKFTATEIEKQNIMGDLEQIYTMFEGTAQWVKDLATQLALIAGMDIYKGQLQSFGGFKAKLYGQETEFRNLQIAQKYGMDFIEQAQYMSANEFITAVESMGFEVDEVADDLLFLADQIFETTAAFGAISSTLKSTRENLEKTFGKAAGSTSVQVTTASMMAQFSKAAKMAMSDDIKVAEQGAAMMASLSGDILQKALSEIPTAYEYEKLYRKLIGTMEDVEKHTESMSKPPLFGTPEQQYTELQKIATDIGQVNTAIKDMLTDATFKTQFDLYQTEFKGGIKIWDNINTNIINLPGLLATALSGYVTGTAPIGGTKPPGAPVPVDTLAQLQTKYAGSTVPLNADVVNWWNTSSVFEKANLSTAFGISPSEMAQDVAALGKALGMPGYATGGISTGPESGYLATLHGTEAIVPLPNGQSIPVHMTGNDNEALVAEVKALRHENKELMKQMNASLKKIKDFYRMAQNDDGTALRTEAVTA